ncbi:20S-pre-rRNA D-site endonuclease NOB1 [Diaporthe helianthi]|uniref:20S-pre-rRNA D-site endonuclease NOB1 n=1 Tax=Diaporthe helianthi TaxID=158607 RepID=A0A2P5HGD2_DIAHE|nr:20S-pre-rRNA D-site endonuclease NOB1 [Diaporthe helianthi]
MTAEQSATAQGQKRIHSLVVDTGPLIKNEPALSTLISQAEQIYTIPSVLSEIKDEATRARVQTTLVPFLKLRSPRPESIKFITDFSRRTGDLEVMSKPDIHLLALCYELEIERNGGDWRIRNNPTQKGLNGKPPAQEEVASDKKEQIGEDIGSKLGEMGLEEKSAPPTEEKAAERPAQAEPEVPAAQSTSEPAAESTAEAISTTEKDDEVALGENENEQVRPEPVQQPEDGEQQLSEDDDSDGWITPSNLKKHQAKDNQVSTPSEAIQETLQAALLTSDFAMQNVALRINLFLVSPSNLSRIKKLKTWVLRCYGCFNVTRQMDKQFCPKCGQATLTRTSCSTDSSGRMQLHLKRNFQYNKRGNVYSIPKPVHGTANGKMAGVQGGGKGHWGKDLILAEDQQEYQRKVDHDRRQRQRDLMDEDYLPNLLTGERTGGHGRIKVGAGRNVNAKKRR